MKRKQRHQKCEILAALTTQDSVQNAEKREQLFKMDNTLKSSLHVVGRAEGKTGEVMALRTAQKCITKGNE